MQFNNLKRACLLFFILITITVFAVKAFAQQQDDNDIYTVVPKSAQYPQGIDSLRRFFSHNIHYPLEARSKHVSGNVFITFVVEKDGSLSGFRVLRGIGAGCDEEALRVLQASAKWTPGERNGKAVRQQYTLPVLFDLNTAKNQKSK